MLAFSLFVSGKTMVENENMNDNENQESNHAAEDSQEDDDDHDDEFIPMLVRRIPDLPALMSSSPRSTHSAAAVVASNETTEVTVAAAREAAEAFVAANTDRILSMYRNENG